MNRKWSGIFSFHLSARQGFFFVLIVLALVPLAAQVTVTTTTIIPGVTTTTLPGTTTTTLPGTTTTIPSTTATTIAYTPYSPDEFPPWANKLRRAEIIAVGAFPLAFLFTGVIYDIARYANFYATGNPNTSEYAPLFFAPSNKPPYTVDENLHLLFSAMAVAVGISLLDFIIGEIQDAANKGKDTSPSLFVAAPGPGPAPPPIPGISPAPNPPTAQPPSSTP